MKNLNELQTKQLAFLDDTAKHYNVNNRGIEEGVCSYKAGGAIGRHILDKELCRQFDSFYNTSVNDNEIFMALPKELQDLKRDFLREIQRLHDGKENWIETGVSQLGKIKYEQIKSNIIYERFN